MQSIIRQDTASPILPVSLITLAWIYPTLLRLKYEKDRV